VTGCAGGQDRGRGEAVRVNKNETHGVKV
jgi:hypothetical protein